MTDVLWFGKPVPWKRTLGSGRRRCLHPAYREWKDDFGWAAKVAHDGAPWDTPTAAWIRVGADSVNARFIPSGVGFPPGTGLVVSRPKGLRGDLDNYVKAVLDSVQGIVIEDDRLIVAIWAAFVPTIRP